MNHEPLKFGLIGAGGIGAVRASALEKSTDCSLTAALDIDPGRITGLAGKAKAFDSREAFFDSGLFDAVMICTPPDTHRELALETLQRGMHVLVEKPMAESVASCREMIEAAETAQRILAVGFNHRFFKGIQVVRRAIREGTIGKLSWIRAFTGHTGLSEFKSPWMYDKAVMGGGTLMDNGVHLLDLVCHLMDDIVTVSGHVRHDFWRLDVEDNAFLHLTDSQGVVCDFHSSWTEWKNYSFFVEAYGDRGMAGMYYAPMRTRITTVDEKGSLLQTQRNFFPLDIFREKFLGWQTTVVDTFVHELGDFVARVHGNSKALMAARGEDGLLACQIANTAYQSSETGQVIQL
jgi:predicted dehydrogenase